MFEKFDDDARRIVLGARNQARGLNREYVDTSHLLLALIAGSKEIAALLGSAGMTYDTLFTKLSRLNALMVERPAEQSGHSPKFGVIVNDSKREAADCGSPSVTPAHVLSALLVQRSGTGREALRMMGIDIAQLHRQTRALFTRA